MRRGTIRAKTALGLLAACSIFVSATPPSSAQPEETLKVGLILPMSGPLAPIGRQINDAVRLYLEQNGDTVEGRKIEILLRNDGGMPNNTLREAKILVSEDKVDVLAGFGTSPSAVIVAPLATQAKIPQIVMGAQTSLVTERSPFIVRSGGTLAQSASTIALWAARHDLHKVVTLISDYAPGIDAAQTFKQTFEAHDGDVVAELRAALADPDFTDVIAQIKQIRPDAVYLYVPPQQTRILLTAFEEQGVMASGIKVIGPGNVTDDDWLPEMDGVASGVVTAHFYSAAHPSEANKQFVAAYEAAYNRRPGFMAVAGYDGMRMIHQALKRTHGRSGGQVLLEAMKDMRWESPRGPVQIDPQTREMIQNIYIRRVEGQGEDIANVEFSTFEAVKDPEKGQKDR